MAGREGGEVDEKLEARYLSLDQAINRYDAEGVGPLRKGEEPFRWSFVEAEARFLLDRISDIRVAIWLLRALTIQSGVQGLREGLQILSNVLAVPSQMVRPFPEDDEQRPREGHSICLSWLGGDAFLALLRLARVDPEASLVLGDVIASSAAVDRLTQRQRKGASRNLEESRNNLIAIRDGFVDSGGYWDRDPILAIEFISDLVRSLSSEKNIAARVEEDRAAIEESAMRGAAASGVAHRVETREDLKKVLEQMLIYYEKNEPAHPAPILLQRVIRILDASFEEVLTELYAESASLVSRIKSPAHQS